MLLLAARQHLSNSQTEHYQTLVLLKLDSLLPAFRVRSQPELLHPVSENADQESLLLKR
jgi:hypothetical protein